MNMEHLKALCAIADHKTFTKAADTLCITQSALSQQIHSLELDLGEPLFIAEGRTKRLSPAGELVLAHARHILQSVDRLASDLAAHRDLSCGMLTIAAGDNLARRLLLTPIGNFARKYPGISIHVRNRTSRESLAMVRSGEADIAVTSLPVQPDGVAVREWKTYSWVAVGTAQFAEIMGANPGQALDLRVLAQQQLILLETGTRLRAVVDQGFSALSCLPQRILEAGSTDLQLDLAALGLGLAIVPDYAVVETELAVWQLPHMGFGMLGLVWADSAPRASCRAFLQEFMG